MEHITIPIPEGLPSDQREDLVQWLTKQAATAVSGRESFENDQAWQFETARRIRAGIDAAQADEVFTSLQARRQLDAKLGIDRML